MSNLPDEIPSLLIPMLSRSMLLPNVAVAEIASWDDPEPQEGRPVWYLGDYHWRGITIPMISLELMNDPELDDAMNGRRVVVLNGLGGAKHDFYAVCVQGIPRLMRVYKQEVANEEVPEEQPSFAYMVTVSGERAMIPDLDYVEQQLSQLN